MNKRASLMNKRASLSNIRKNLHVRICSKKQILTLFYQFNLSSF